MAFGSQSASAKHVSSHASLNEPSAFTASCRPFVTHFPEDTTKRCLSSSERVVVCTITSLALSQSGCAPGPWVPLCRENSGRGVRGL